MTVAELIKFLQEQPQDLPVAHRMHSEQCLMEKEQIIVCELGMPRIDGWVQSRRSDKESQKYLLFPGN